MADPTDRATIAVADSLTVEFSKMPGKSFHRKVLSKSTISLSISICSTDRHECDLRREIDSELFKYSDVRDAGTYDHRLRRIGHPVRSAIHKPQIGRLVVGWVTTSESLLLYVFFWQFF